MLTFISDYITTPVINAATHYVLNPAYDFAMGKTKEIATKTVCATVVKTAVKPLVGLDGDNDGQPEAEAVHFADRVANTLHDLPKNGKYALQGLLLESGTQAVLTGIQYINPTPQGKVLSYLAPRAMNLASTNRECPSIVKAVACGAMSHAVGTLAQEGFDAMFPTAAPYGGFVAYGAASGVTGLGLDKAYNYFKPRA